MRRYDPALDHINRGQPTLPAWAWIAIGIIIGLLLAGAAS